MKQLFLKKPKWHDPQLLFLLSLLFAQIANANPDRAVNSGDRARTSKSQATAQDPKGTDVREIKQGQVINGGLKRAEIHTYSVALKAGEYMRVAVDQHRTALEVQALDPAGRPIATINVGGEGLGEALWALAEAAGDYQIIITAPHTEGFYGYYSISLEKVAELRTAAPSDRLYLKAHGLLFDGDQLINHGDEPSLRRAVEKFEEALQLWKQLSERIEEAYTLHELAYTYSGLKDLPKALELYSQAVSLWRATKNHELDEATSLYNMGSLYSFAGRTAEAMECYQRAIELRRLMEDWSGLGYALTNLGQLYINIGEFQAALKSHQEALRLRRQIGDGEGEARSLSNIAGVFFRLGDLQESLNYSLQALPLRRAVGDRRGEAITLTNIGSNYRELGEPQKALGYYQQALALIHRTDTHRTDDRYVEGTIFDGIGRSFYDLGDYAKALDNYNQSLSLRQMPKEPYGEASTLANIGNVYAGMGNREKALAYFEQALELQRAISDRRGQALTLQKAGELYEESGDLKRARQYLDEGLALSRAIKNRSCEANLLYDIARTEKSAGHPIEARSQIEAALAIIESTRARVSSTDLRASFLASKQEFYELEIDLLMQSDRGDRNQERVVKAFGVSEQRRARSLLDSLEEPRVRIHRGLSPELLTRERELHARLNQKTESQIKLLSGKYTTEEASALAKEVDTIATDYEQLLTEIRTTSPLYASLTQPVPLSLRDIQANILDTDTLLLEFSLGNERSYLWAVTPTDVTGYELPGRAEIESQARNIYDLLTARNRFVKFEKSDERQARIAKTDAEYSEASRRLSQVLLGPIAARLKGKRLLIVSDGALQYLPFAALPSPVVNLTKGNEQTTREAYRPLIVDHEVTNLPSASILGLLRREVAGRKPAPKSVAVLADPVFSKTDERVIAAQADQQPGDQRASSHQTVRGVDAIENELVRAVRDVGGENGLEIDRLPSTRKEAEAILGLVPKTDRFEALDFHANRLAAMSPELSQYRFVHFATHGLLNSSHPGLSGLIFSLVDRQGNDQRGFLPAHEVFDLDLPADLVVLSGCRTGLGKEIKGEGMLGLTRGFMYAGAARVAVSLWDVSDQSTAELMARFYRGMLGKRRLSPAAALREAQVAMWKSAGGRAPYYWAAFVLQGEYR
jgi:CHAT domain-containing protein/Tfp pilus assembly protein PilF